MNIFKWFDSIIKTMKWYHIALIKISVAAAILMVAKLWNGILVLDWYWYLLIMVIAMIPLFGKMFCNGCGSAFKKK